MIDFLSGTVAMAYLVVGVFFLRFWRKTSDRLFLLFSAAFGLFAANQTIATLLGATDERTGYTYILRILGFVVILFAIVDKNTSSRNGNTPQTRPLRGTPAPTRRRNRSLPPA